MSAEDLIRTARDDAYAGRVAMIQLKVAQNVASEAPTTPNHAERVSYASLVIRGGENPKMVASHVNTNPSIAAQIAADPAKLGANVPDTDIEFTLASIWDARSIAWANATVPSLEIARINSRLMSLDQRIDALEQA
jgi:hypothetical protein